MSAIPQACHDIADQVDAYITERLFDPQRLMYSSIDSFTGEPFERSFITASKVPRRAEIDPWAYWTYEDSVMASGLYADAMVLKYEVTGEDAALDAAAERWRTLRNTYAASQVHGIGTFLRPYGGYVTMHRFMEPLGTDQASPMFSGLYRYMKHAPPKQQALCTELLLRTLTWYEQQQFSYFYYASFIHEYDPDTKLAVHPTSYYLPAVAWAANVTDDQRWARHRDERLPLFAGGRHNIALAFLWGSDLLILRELLGERFEQTFSRSVLDAGYEHVLRNLETYSEPGLVKRLHPASKEPGFVPYVRDGFDRERGLGFAYFSTVHGGRTRPRHERHTLAALAGLGYPGAFEKAVELLALPQRVPLDFTAFLSEDYDQLPEEVHLYARSVGVCMVGWLRDYWLLRSLAADATTAG